MPNNKRDKWHNAVLRMPVFLEKIAAVLLLVGVIYGIFNLIKFV